MTLGRMWIGVRDCLISGSHVVITQDGTLQHCIDLDVRTKRLSGLRKGANLLEVTMKHHEEYSTVTRRHSARFNL